jgi:hypothetical protein
VLESARAALLSVPRKALTETPAGWQVQVNQGGKPVARPVKVGAVGEQQVEIQEGLKPGDRVWVPTGG